MQERGKQICKARAPERQCDGQTDRQTDTFRQNVRQKEIDR